MSFIIKFYRKGVKMARSTVYNQITTPELIEQISEDNRELSEDFLIYLESVDRSPKTIKTYRNNLQIFFIWNLQHNKNKYFVDLTKREIVKFQNHALNIWEWSSNRIRTVKSTLSSLSNYIEDILDDEYEDYRSIINKIESPKLQPRREKTVIEDSEVDRVLGELVEEKEYQMACVLALAAMSGARKSELLLFKVDYFNDENIIFDALYKTPEKIRTKGSGVDGKKIYKYTLIDFKKYFDLWMKEREELGIENEWLFVTKQKGEWKHMRVSTLNSWTTKYSELFGVPFYFHSMRHYLNTKLLQHNLPNSIIQEYFGWSSTDMIEIYNDTEASEEFGKYFTGDGIVNVKDGGLGDI